MSHITDSLLENPEYLGKVYFDSGYTEMQLGLRASKLARHFSNIAHRYQYINAALNHFRGLTRDRK